MRARVLSSVDIGSCTALMPRSPHTVPQRPIAVSNIAKLWPVMAGSKSCNPDFLIERHELDICLESRLGKSCDPPEFRRNLAPSNENEAKVRDFPPGVTGHSGARVKRACPKIHNHHREYGFPACAKDRIPE